MEKIKKEEKNSGRRGKSLLNKEEKKKGEIVEEERKVYLNFERMKKKNRKEKINPEKRNRS